MSLVYVHHFSVSLSADQLTTRAGSAAIHASRVALTAASIKVTTSAEWEKTSVTGNALRSALANVTRDHPPELERCRSGCHRRVLGCKLAKHVLVVFLDHREPVGVPVGENGAEHDHVAALEVRPPVDRVAAHDLALRVGQRLSEVRARRDEAEDEGGHTAGLYACATILGAHPLRADGCARPQADG